MTFGRVVAPRSVGLPALDDEALTWLAAIPRAGGSPRFRVGGVGWAAGSWPGGLLPAGVAPGERLSAYARALSAVELSASFHALPTAEAVRRWRSQVGPGFQFCPRFPEQVSRGLSLGRVNRRVARAFVAVMTGLGPALGPCVLSLPPTVGRAVLVPLAELLADLAASALHVAVEVQSPALVERGRLDPELAALLRAHGATVAITDDACAPDLVHSTLTSRHVVVRFIRAHPHVSDLARVGAWVDRLSRWVDAGLESAWILVDHSGDERGAPELCRALSRQLNERLGVSLPLWRTQGQLAFSFAGPGPRR